MAIITCEMIILYDFYTYTIIKKFTLTEIFKMLFSNIFDFSYPTFFSFIFQFSLTKISYYWVIFFGLSYFTIKHQYSFIFQLAFNAVESVKRPMQISCDSLFTYRSKFVIVKCSNYANGRNGAVRKFILWINLDYAGAQRSWDRVCK